MKKKVLFATLHRPDRSPSQRFRFEQYLGFLKENGFEYDLSYLLNKEDDRYFYSKGKYFKKAQILLKSISRRFHDISMARKYDIIFVQREAFMIGNAFFERKYAQKSKLIFDFDDAIWLQQVSKSSAPNKNLLWLKNFDKTKKIIQMANMIFACGQYLANYASRYNSNVKIVPTTIDTDYHKPNNSLSKKNDKVCIGWTGSKTTVDHFTEILPILVKIKEKYNNKVIFKVIGDEDFKHDYLNIQGIRWEKETEINHLSKLDIGVMPLPDDEWSKGKCGFKGLQYMALEIPVVASAVGGIKEVVQNGVNGYLVSSDREWINTLELLINTPELRRKIGKESRKTIEKFYSVNAWQDRYLNYFNEVLD